jgi:hypothetical protein
MNTTRIPKNLPPFTPNGNGDGYDVSPAGVVLLAAQWAYPQQGQAPETLATQTKAKQFIHAVATQAASKGCRNWQRWLSDLASPTTQARFVAATELVSSMTYADFSTVMQQCGFSIDPR